MEFWLTRMPSNMHLKSEGFASNLDDPKDSFTLRRFCESHRIDYADMGMPVSLETFTAYGLSFKDAMVPELEEKKVVALSRGSRGFELVLDDGEVALARQVVVAAGIGHFTYVPSSLTALPDELLSHSSQHSDLRRFAGRRVAVIGGGSSATDLATLLHDAGAEVCLIARRDRLNFNEKPTGVGEFSNSLWRQIREPMSGIGPGWRYKIFGDAPWIFRYLPRALRHRIVRRSHGPAGAWFVEEKVWSGPTVLLGHVVEQANVSGDTARIQLRTAGGASRQVDVDHVIAATGYKVDIGRLPFLSKEMLPDIKSSGDAPVLSANLESNVPGLYFIGTVAANTFGPVMRFVFGARFAARRVSRALARCDN
jgi:thioredoxin reductase